MKQGGIPPRTASPGNRVPHGIAVARGCSCGVSLLFVWLVFLVAFWFVLMYFFLFPPNLVAFPGAEDPTEAMGAHGGEVSTCAGLAMFRAGGPEQQLREAPSPVGLFLVGIS